MTSKNSKDVRLKLSNNIYKIIARIAIDEGLSVPEYFSSLAYKDIKARGNKIPGAPPRGSKSPVTAHVNPYERELLRTYCHENGISYSSALRRSIVFMAGDPAPLLKAEVAALNKSSRALESSNRQVNQLIALQEEGLAKNLPSIVLKDLSERIRGQLKDLEDFKASANDRRLKDE